MGIKKYKQTNHVKNLINTYVFERDEKATDQHSGSDIELLFKLGDEDVDWDQVAGVCLLHLTDNVRHPLKLSLGACHPYEVHLVDKIQIIAWHMKYTWWTKYKL